VARESVTSDAAAAVFEAQRGRLFGLAYRLLGSASDAEDVLQDAFLRWAANGAATGSETAGRSTASEDTTGEARTSKDRIIEPAAWLTTVVTNLCLTQLTSARQRRERYTGTWLPEPVLTGDGSTVAAGPGLGPLETAAQRESVSMALLLLCEELTAPERAVFILHEAFGYRYGEIADIIGRSEAACRQLGHRAATRLREEAGEAGPGGRPRPARFTPPGPEEAARWRRLTGQFLAAAVAGDVAGLERMLADDVVSWADGGGKVPAGVRPVLGRVKVARLFASLGPGLAPGADRTPAMAHAFGSAGHLEVSEAEVNGTPALLVWADGEVFTVFVPVIEGDKITALYTIAAPDKLAVAARQARQSRNSGLSRNTGPSSQ
jgi:RNA polymerase sigma-70 factor (ECF subfamily)